MCISSVQCPDVIPQCSVVLAGLAGRAEPRAAADTRTAVTLRSAGEMI